jgi:nucleoside-diphosphate-sugar epimerase
MFKELKNKTILVTGATGLIGKAIVFRLLAIGANVVVLVRDRQKAERLFGDNVQYIVSDITSFEVKEMNLDYIIHGASNTSSKAFIENPVEVSFTALDGTRRVLELAKLCKIQGLVYLSSMEVYGTPTTDDKVFEDSSTSLDSMKVRSAYPESKRMCECLCSSYASEYDVPAKVVRLTQTFGPGVQYDDGRVFAQFARCAIEEKDIILHTKGETKRNYLYTEDAVDAILTVLLKGKVGEAYNAANEDTYCSIYEMANLVAKECSEGCINVLVEEQDVSKFGYAPTLHMNLNTRKLRDLGWKPSTDLKNMFTNMISDMKKQR